MKHRAPRKRRRWRRIVATTDLMRVEDAHADIYSVAELDGSGYPGGQISSQARPGRKGARQKARDRGEAALSDFGRARSASHYRSSERRQCREVRACPRRARKRSYYDRKGLVRVRVSEAALRA